MNRLFRGVQSLKARLALAGALLIAASVVLTTYVVLRETSQRTLDIVTELEHAQVQRLAGAIAGRIQHLEHTLLAAAHKVNAAELDNAPRMAQLLRDNDLLAQLFSNVFIVRRDGQVQASLIGNSIYVQPEQIVNQRPYFTLAQQSGGKLVMSPPFMGRQFKSPIVVLAVPLQDGRGQFAGLMAGALVLNASGLLTGLDTSAQRQQESGVTTLILDKQGLLIMHPQADRLMQPAAGDAALGAAVRQWQARRAQQDAPHGAFVVADELVAAAAVGNDWVVMRVSRLDHVLQPHRAGTQRSALMAVLVALWGGMVLFALTYRMLRPLKQLEQRAQALLSHELPMDQGWPQARGEIGQLSQALREIMQQKERTEAQDRRHSAMLEMLMERSPQGLALTIGERINRVNASWSQMTELPAYAMQGQSAEKLLSRADHAHLLLQRIHAAMHAEGFFREEIAFTHTDGSIFWGLLESTLLNPHDVSEGILWQLRDITHERAQRERLLWHSTRDPLTELLNRRAFESRLQAWLERRQPDEMVSALFLDLDHFKRVNDDAGHAAGDAMLRAVAQLMQQQVRSHDTIARLGGDEFAMLLFHCDAHRAAQVAAKICQAIEHFELEWNGQRYRVGVSIGVTQMVASYASVAQVLHDADQACYAAKRSGRNCVCVHGDPPHVAARPSLSGA